MAAHVRLKNEFMMDEKYHNLMRWLICCNTEKSMDARKCISKGKDEGLRCSRSQKCYKRRRFKFLCKMRLPLQIFTTVHRINSQRVVP